MSAQTPSAGNTAATPDHDMLTGPVVRTFWKYCLPWSLSMVATGSATIVDGIFVGRCAGAMPLAAVNLVTPVWSLISGLGIMLATGGSVRCGRYMGEGDLRGASAMLIKTMAAMLLLTVAVCGAAFAGRNWLLDFLGADAALRPYSADYLTVLLLFGPVFPLSFALSYFIRVDRRPVLASVGMALCAVFNIGFDALFVGVWGMGVRGAALATGLAYALPCLVLASHFVSRKSSYVWLRPKAWGKWGEILYAAWNGASEFVNEISAGIVILLFNRILMDRLGGYGVAAFTVVNYATLMGMTLFYGIGDSLAPIISVNRGARAYGRVKAFRRTALISVMTLGAGFFTFLSLAPELLTELFLPAAPEASAITLAFIHACRWAFLFSGLNMVLASSFTGMQWANSSMLVAVSRSFVLPVLMLALLPRLLGADGIFYASTVAEALTLVLAVGLFAFGQARFNRWEAAAR